jgi:hypothetical protein
LVGNSVFSLLVQSLIRVNVAASGEEETELKEQELGLKGEPE